MVIISYYTFCERVVTFRQNILQRNHTEYTSIRNTIKNIRQDTTEFISRKKVTSSSFVITNSQHDNYLDLNVRSIQTFKLRFSPLLPCPNRSFHMHTQTQTLSVILMTTGMLNQIHNNHSKLHNFSFITLTIKACRHTLFLSHCFAASHCCFILNAYTLID